MYKRTLIILQELIGNKTQPSTNQPTNQSYDFTYSYPLIILLNRSIWPEDGTQEVTIVAHDNHNHNDINNNDTTNTYSNTVKYKTQATLLFRYEPFINFLNSVLQREDRDNS